MRPLDRQSGREPFGKSFLQPPRIETTRPEKFDCLVRVDPSMPVIIDIVTDIEALAMHNNLYEKDS